MQTASMKPDNWPRHILFSVASMSMAIAANDVPSVRTDITVSHLSSAGDSEVNENLDRNKTTEPTDPWAPLWSGLLFTFGMLFLGCSVFQFRDY